LVGQPLDDDQVDIAEINSDAFEACQRLVRDVADGGFSAALTVFGDAGTGKTHLVGRVRRWLEKQPGNLFIFVRMETSPAGIWRHLRRSLAIALLRANLDGVRALDLLLKDRRNNLETLENRDLSVVLEHLWEGRHVRDSAAWLRGEGLPDEVLGALRLSAPGPDDEPEVISRHVVMAICELIRPCAAVFCMDQIEAVMSSPGDRDGPHAFGRVVSCLVDEARNAGVICCEQSSFVNLMEQILDDAARTRVFGRRAAIRPLSWEQAQRLIGARLDTIPELAAERSAHEDCWPLAAEQIRNIFVDNAAPARKILTRCKDLFDLWSGKKAEKVEPLDTALQTMLDERFIKRDPAETEEILRNGLPLLTRAAGLKCSVPGNRSPLDFAINEGQVAIVICNEANTRSLAHRLRKISEARKQQATNVPLLMLRDARLPIPRTARASHQRIAGLEEQGGRMVTVSQEAVEALAALRRLLADAESGDLTHRGEPVRADTVERWIAGHLPAALDQLVSALGTPSPAKPDLAPRLAALLAEKKMIKLEDAARSLEVTPGEVEECSRRDPRQFGFFGGSVPALFQPVTASDR
jgi:hypothetical protein